ncbi:DUF4136 domain-containing protein [Echinicola jeungdonensis]|uniref:DUF4136 domain-containing protein n=1 Tax=Echinicola jeungdonensis TaxID=709343 RepID=A0ABV5J2Z0_9BACT|nr:DUF4136 domain-containing protein [Echinicola jeungdonensis]MDN3670567.1 DUF4136 domain-containing protein [Echinicola jeungdonensis]
MKIRVLIALIIPFLLVVSCSPVKIYTEKSELNYEKSYKTFAIINQYKGKNAWNSPVLDQNLVHNLTEGMKEMGYEPDRNSPDLILRYNTLLSEGEKEVSQYPGSMWGYGMYNPWMYRMPYPYWGNPTKLEKYDLGELVIDFIDPRADQVILRISAVGEVNNPKQKYKNIKISVEKILHEFSKKVEAG